MGSGLFWGSGGILTWSPTILCTAEALLLPLEFTRATDPPGGSFAVSNPEELFEACEPSMSRTLSCTPDAIVLQLEVIRAPDPSDGGFAVPSPPEDPSDELGMG